MDNFKTFIRSLITEELHPELKAIVQAPPSSKNRKTLVVNKIKELSERGEPTGVEGNMPSGSSRAYIKHKEPAQITIDGQTHHIPYGTKIAIRSTLDAHHNKDYYDGMTLGQMQNHAENGDSFTDHHRVLSRDIENGTKAYKTNKMGVFPPLIDHDEKNHMWSDVGHVENITHSKFEKMTKTPEFPDGITHNDFVKVLFRSHQRAKGNYWDSGKKYDEHMDRLEDHPLVEKFLAYHANGGTNPSDYSDIGNMGVWKHPNGTEHIVARDHGFSDDVNHAYNLAKRKKNARKQGYTGDEF
jgi:hypothetical protein